MPPKIKVTKEDIVAAALDIVRQQGTDGLNARAVAAKLNCSTQPVFSNYDSMEALKADVLDRANAIYLSYLQREMANGEFPPYKASGIAYIRFASEEKQLFRLLFMRDRSGEDVSRSSDELDSLVAMIQKNTGLSKEEAYIFHLEMWVFVHGIATMLVTSYLEWDWDMISRMLTDNYQGMIRQYLSDK